MKTIGMKPQTKPVVKTDDVKEIKPEPKKVEDKK